MFYISNKGILFIGVAIVVLLVSLDFFLGIQTISRLSSDNSENVPHKRLAAVVIADDLTSYKEQSAQKLLLTDIEKDPKEVEVFVDDIEEIEVEDEIEEAIQDKIIEDMEPKKLVYIIDELGSTSTYSATKFVNLNEWTNVYGKATSLDGRLNIGADGGTSSFILLNKGGDWSNYRANLLMDWHKGSSVSLVFRYEDNKNYVYCGYSLYANSVTMYKVIDGKKTKLGKSPRVALDYLNPWSDVEVSIEVVDNTTTCLIRGQRLLSHTINDMPSEGAFGLKTWAKDVGYSQIGIKEISIEAI